MVTPYDLALFFWYNAAGLILRQSKTFITTQKVEFDRPGERSPVVVDSD